MEKKKEYWYYIVRQDYTDAIGEGGNYYKHDEKAEALRRASKFMDLSIQNLCSDYRMGKLPIGLPHKIILRICYAESFDGGATCKEVIIEEKRLADYIGNIPLE